MRKALTAILFIVLFFEIKAQSRESSFTQKFNAYQASLPKTKIHLVFNQEKFSPGDTAYFKAYFLTEDLSGVGGKQLIELNLVDSKGESKLHFSFTITNGIGQNQIAIPLSLPAGIYLVVAHSSWMKNFNPLPFFKKEIIVVSKNVIVRDEKPFVITAVEGGHLIRDIDNKAIIRSYRAGGSVKIIDAVGQAIAETSTDINGVGSITFKPLRKVSYFIRVDYDSTKIPLPVVEDDGCRLQLTQARREDPIKVIVTSPPGSSLRNEELVLIVSARSKIRHTSSFLLGTKDFVELLIPHKDWPEGIAHISLLNHNGTLLASRDFYHQGEGEVQAKIQIGKKYLQARDKVRVEVLVTDTEGHPLEGEFTIKVLNAGLFDFEMQNSLSDELTILSGLPEKYLIDRSDPNWLVNLDNYLISSTEEVPWKAIMANTTIKPRFTFSNFVQKSGKAYYAETHKTVPDLTDIMFYLQRSGIRYQTIVEKDKVWLAIPDLFGQDELFYFGETFFYVGGEKHGEPIPNLKIEWDDESIQLPHSPVSKETDNSDHYASFTNKCRLIDRSYAFYASPSAAHVSNKGREGRNGFETEVNGADVTIRVQNYIIFPTMAELVKEIIPSLQHRKTNGKDIVRITLSESMSAMATGDPLYVIDGIATKNTDFFLSLKPADLLTVKIIFDPAKLLRFGLLGKNGIVLVQTKNGDAREPLNDSTKLIEGLNRPVNFKTVDHANDQHLRRPDFRSTVYWNPSIKTDSNGSATIEFYCSDDIGLINIRVEGLATGDRPFSAEEKIEVINPKKK